jgi:hypothetical protein
MLHSLKGEPDEEDMLCMPILDTVERQVLVGITGCFAFA